jgi:GxxExxY protein
MVVYGIAGARESRELMRIRMTEIIYKNESYAIIGACFEVYNEKGCGFLEPVYQECLGIEFEHQRIPSIPKPSLTLSYRGRILNQTYAPDYVCFEKIIVELKAASSLTDEHRAQLLNYLHATGFELGLLVNFGSNTNALPEPSLPGQILSL